MSNKKAQQVLKELFIRCRKLNISLCFLTQSYFSVPKDVRLNCTHVIFKLNNKRLLQNIAINHSADIDYKDFVKIYRNSTKEPCSNKTNSMKDLVINAQNFYDGREMVINAFKDKIFPKFFLSGYPYDYPPEDESLSDGEEDRLLESKDFTNRLDKLLINLDEILDPDLVEKYFDSKSLREW